MTFVHGKDGRVLVNEKSASGQISGYTVTHTREYGTVTALGDDGYKAIPGLLGGSLAINGMFDSAGNLHAEVGAAHGSDNAALWTVLPDGSTIGKPAFIVRSDIDSYEVNASITEAVAVTVSGMPDDGVDLGVSLHAHAAETADGNGTAVDNDDSTANGGVASLHVTAFSGLTNAVIKVQHSADDDTYTDLVTFTTVTGATSERKTVTGTVNQYLRATVDVTGTGSVTYAVAFARR